MVRPSETSYSTPSTLIFAISELEGVLEGALSLAQVELEVAAEVAQQALNGPGGGVRKSADRLALHLGRHVLEHRQVVLAPLTALDALEDLVQPAGALAALRALAARLVAEEVRDDAARAHHAGVLVHHHDAAGAQHGLALAQELVGHAHVELVGRQDRHRHAAGDHALDALAR